jgi:hypothetical protein
MVKWNGVGNKCASSLSGLERGFVYPRDLMRPFSAELMLMRPISTREQARERRRVDCGAD